MSKPLIVGIIVIVLMVCSLTGLAYCGQQGLDSVGPILGFMAFLTIALTTLGVGAAYGLSHALNKLDEHARDIASASIEVAKETAEETVENLPEVLMGGIEKSMKKTRDRFFGEIKLPWGRKSPSSGEPPEAGRKQPASGSDSAIVKPEPRPSYDKAESYRRMIDDAIDKVKDKRKHSN